jgi:dephospho-CoA kinase
MKIIGITGRSGCGKSSVTEFLSAQGYCTVDADRISREVLLPGSPCLAKLSASFGADILDADGTLRRRLLADRAFATTQGTEMLTAITFPEIAHRVQAAAAAAEAQGAVLFFVDGAVIVGTPFADLCDAILVVTAPYELSVQRICTRDGISREMAMRRLDAQMPEQALCDAASFVVVNDDTKEKLQAQVRRILQSLREEDYEKAK